METITFKVDESFATEIGKAMARGHYATKTEFIREAIREKLSKSEQLKHLLSIYGASKRRTTDKQLHEAGERAVDDLLRMRGLR